MRGKLKKPVILCPTKRVKSICVRQWAMPGLEEAESSGPALLAGEGDPAQATPRPGTAASLCGRSW